MTVRVAVPATSANLGPGFDCLGLALGLENEIEIRVADRPTIRAEGEGADHLRRDPANLAYRSAVTGYETSGRTAPPFAITLINRIPLARGLGSSSAAIVGGLLAGSTLAGTPLSRQSLVDLAARIEGHPDNVAPAIYGGCTIALRHNEHVLVTAVPVRNEYHGVVYVPQASLATREARAVLPGMVRRADAVFNLGRVALLVAALATDLPDLLPIASEDRLHQPARTALIPALPRIIAGAFSAGARLAALSGAGPSVLALVDRNQLEVGEAMRVAAGEFAGRTLTLPIHREGARLVG